LITSSQNPKLKLVRALIRQAKERREANAFVVEGVRLIEEAVNAEWQFQFALYSDGLSERGMDLISKLSDKDVEVDDVAGDLLHKLSDTENPQGILAVLKPVAVPDGAGWGAIRHTRYPAVVYPRQPLAAHRLDSRTRAVAAADELLPDREPAQSTGAGSRNPQAGDQ
jgi:tRNA G18 (ribose-2'-O)-methylase SpoU